MREIGSKYNKTPAQVILRWIVQRGIVTYNKTPAQVILRWIVQRGIVTIPASKNIAHMRENFNIFDFSLDRADLLKIAELDTPHRMLDHANPDTIKWFNEREIGTTLKR